MENVTFKTAPLEFENYFAYMFSIRSSEKYTIHRNVKKLHKEYLEVYVRTLEDLWQSCRFHFEIRWSGNIPLQETKVVRVVVHIESGDYIKNQELTSKIRTYYEKAKGDNIIVKKIIDVDFSSEELTIKSIDRIQRILESDCFQEIIAKVNEFA